MKSHVCNLIAALLLAATLAGCANIKHESAMEWLQSQPMDIDDP